MYFSGVQSEGKYEFGYCILAILNIYTLWPVFLDFAHAMQVFWQRVQKGLLFESSDARRR